jgi:hypothetical protein
LAFHAECRELFGPVQSVAGVDLLPPAAHVNLHAVAVVLDLMEALVALRRFGLQGGELGLMNPGVSIRFGTQETHKSPPHLGGQRRAFYLLPENPEQSGDVIAVATTDVIKVVR